MKYLIIVSIFLVSCATKQPCPEVYQSQGIMSALIDSSNYDLVCGGGKAMLKNSTLKQEYKRKVYKFCSISCKKAFTSSPSKYVK